MEEKSWIDLLKVLNDNKVDTLICGGINTEHKQLYKDYGIDIIDNVVSSDEEIIDAIQNKRLRSGFGFKDNSKKSIESSNEEDNKGDSWFLHNSDCLACPDQECLEGKSCSLSSQLSSSAASRETRRILESAIDISLEEERTLCRISEIVYFALELSYKKIGVAYCIDLSEPAEIFTQVMRRFFDVFPVCCKIGGQKLADPMELRTKKIACNPQGQAEVLNKIGVDLNIMMGLCIGADCIFSKSSNAPVTTLFVKDKSLANNPIGAVYSDYYLQEVSKSSNT
jgi:uncharacterized metal-binding protein